MSLADKFENHMEPAFTRSFDRESARRQLHLSIILVLAMALAAFILGFVSPINSKYQQNRIVLAPDSEFSGRLITGEDQ
jgi:hypothetical protein